MSVPRSPLMKRSAGPKPSPVPTKRREMESESGSTLTTYSDPDIAITSQWVSAYTNVIASMVYEGFSPTYMREQLKKMARNAGADLNADIPILVLLYITRGANITKIMQSISDDGLAYVRPLIERYRIQARVGSDKKCITLPRIAACFPSMVASGLEENTSRN